MSNRKRQCNSFCFFFLVTVLLGLTIPKDPFTTTTTATALGLTPLCYLLMGDTLLRPRICLQLTLPRFPIANESQPRQHHVSRTASNALEYLEFGIHPETLGIPLWLVFLTLCYSKQIAKLVPCRVTLASIGRQSLCCWLGKPPFQV
ncbi:hypothetical protein DFH94DRAFT_794 [Russula ochroleuca]|uniref:Uncharacterized protein n=1 Tax=Russula ochroleuca TaxID=152965 RepID=A0A9P5N565_9AGAM|nr:hypothetical protein DFH94DRAFT_794 [Russula ochroleuca]